jgi:phage tail tape-measure protein
VVKPALFSVAAALLVACAQILDIEDAHLVTRAGAGGVVGANAAGASPTAGAGGANDVTSTPGDRLMAAVVTSAVVTSAAVGDAGGGGGACFQSTRLQGGAFKRRGRGRSFLP